MSALDMLTGGGSPGAGSGSNGPAPSIQIGGYPSQQLGAPAGKGDGDWEEDLQAALDALRALANDATDHGETNIIDKCIAALSALPAKRQAGAESALGVTPAHKAMSRQSY
jgi:hypothetical protein